MSRYSRTPRKIGSMSSRQTGSLSTKEIPLSHTYYALALSIAITAVTVTAANVATYIDKIELKINGEPRFVIYGHQLADYYAQRGITMKDNFIPILLAMPHMRTAAGEDVSGYGTLDVNDFDIEVSLAAGVHVIERLELYALRGPNTPLGPHLRLTSYPRPVTGAGDYELTGITRARQRIMAVFIDTNQINSVLLMADAEVIHDTNDEVREGFLAAISDRTQGGKCFIDLDSSSRLEDGFEVDGRHVSFTLDMLAAVPDMNVLVESIELMGS